MALALVTKKTTLLVLALVAFLAGTVAAWLPLGALHQDSGTASLSAAGELRIPLLVNLPVVVGGQFSFEAFTEERVEDVVFQILFNGRLMEESGESISTSFTIDEPRGSPESLVFVAINPGPEPILIRYYADASRPAFPAEKLLLGTILFLPVGAPVTINQLALHLRPELATGPWWKALPVLLTGWVFFLYVESLIGFFILYTFPAFRALWNFLLFLFLFSVRTPLGLLPMFSAATGLILSLGAQIPAAPGWWRLSVLMGAIGLAVLGVMPVLTAGVGR